MTEKIVHPIICLWCHPRSMSTAIERVMRERGDLKCFHEPFMYDYYVHRNVEHMPHFEIDPTAPVSYEDIKAMLLDQARLSPVFIKDMSYYIVPGIFSDPDFARRLTHTFLIRHPKLSILSYFKLDNNLTLEQIGLEAQYRHVEWLQKKLGYTPVILLAEKIQQDARAVITDYWRRLGLEIKSHAFDWDTGHMPSDWQQVSGWHDDVSNSRGIRKSTAANVQHRQHEFDRLAKIHPKLKQFLNHHIPFYNKLKSLSVA